MKRISSSDVAKEAGVSRATVSYVLNDIHHVKIKPETREKVLLAAEKLGYHPNSSARALKTSKSSSIGVVSRRDISHERFSLLLKGIREVFKDHQYSITLCSDELDHQGHTEYMNYYLQRKIDGVILISAEEPLDPTLLQQLHQYNIPSVLVDYHIKGTHLNCINIDYFQGAYGATKYLLENNHRKLMYLAPDLPIPQEIQRRAGVIQALYDQGLSSENLKVFSAGRTDGEFHSTILEVLKNRGDHTSLIVSWIGIAFDTLYQAAKLHIQIPADLSVIALAGSYYADQSYPKLSTCDLPLYEIGVKSAETLLASLEAANPPVDINLPCTLRIRESVSVYV